MIPAGLNARLTTRADAVRDPHRLGRNAPSELDEPRRLILRTPLRVVLSRPLIGRAPPLRWVGQRGAKSPIFITGRRSAAAGGSVGSPPCAHCCLLWEATREK